MAHQPVTLRFTVCLRLSTGEIAGIQMDYLNQAVSFAKRMSGDGGWWEVLDNVTKNCVASSFNTRRPPDDFCGK